MGSGRRVPERHARRFELLLSPLWLERCTGVVRHRASAARAVVAASSLLSAVTVARRAPHRV